MIDGIAEAGRYWFIWKCVELGAMLTVMGTVGVLAWRFIKNNTKKED